jgi:hypothetical protein
MKNLFSNISIWLSPMLCLKYGTNALMDFENLRVFFERTTQKKTCLPVTPREIRVPKNRVPFNGFIFMGGLKTHPPKAENHSKNINQSLTKQFNYEIIFVYPFIILYK